MSPQNIYTEIFFLYSKYKSVIQIPENKKTYYQIKSGTSGIYNVSENSTVNVNKYGTITPRNETIYWYGNTYYKEPQPGKTFDRKGTLFFPGLSTVNVIEGDDSYKIYIYVADYCINYSDEIFKSYFETNITDKENDLEKFKSIVAFAAQYPYNSSNNEFWDLVVFKSGSDWGSCNVINRLCDLINIRSKTRIAYNDPDGYDGHLNIAALIEGKVYIADVGYDPSNNIKRPWNVTERNKGFSYVSEGNGIIIYQYDGFDKDVNVPSVIDNKTVIGFKYQCFRNGLIYNGKIITKITLPYTIIYLGDKTFRNLVNLSEVNIPIKVQEINLDNFIGCENLSSINVDKDNSEYSSIDGILFNKNQTIIFKCPIMNKNENFSSPPSLNKIEEYAFHNVKNIEIMKLKKMINYIGEYAFANSSVKEIYFYGEKPEFGENALLNLNVTIYYPEKSTTWNKSNFDSLGAKDVRYVSWNPIEEKEKENEKEKEKEENEKGGTEGKGKDFFEEHKTLLIIIISIGILLLLGIIIFIIVIFIKKRKTKSPVDIECIQGELISI